MEIEDIKLKERLNKGWSEDIKYHIVTNDNEEYLLRISNPTLVDKKIIENEYMIKAFQLGVPVCFPFAYGIKDEGFYSLQKWVDGEDLITYISKVDEKKQYEYGIQAGKYLRLIQSIDKSRDNPSWDEVYNNKIEKTLIDYEACDEKYDKGQLLIDVVKQYRHLIKGRKSTFQHGDYHIGNMMVDKNGNLIIIDFNRCSFGDPYEEFNRMSWNIDRSIPFSKGIIDGYFDNKEVPLIFWKLMKLYICRNQLNCLPWAIPFGQAEIDIMKEHCKDLMKHYDDMKLDIPTWYQD